MIRVALVYSRDETSNFDERYYVEHHVPLSRATFLGLGMIRGEWDHVVAQARVDVPEAYAISYQYWRSVDEARQAFASEAAATVRADTHNFYSGLPTVFFSEINVPGSSSEPNNSSEPNESSEGATT